MLKDLSGQKFGRLVAIERVEKNKRNNARWLCRCDCGKSVVVDGGNLTRGHTMSCGCLRAENRVKHGLCGTRLCNIWYKIKSRCSDPNNDVYHHYGGRGITICEEWRNDFRTFYEWAMKNGYADNLTIDRIDVNGNYCPENCRWVEFKEQMNNTRRNRFLTFKGETKTVAQWSEELSIKPATLYTRLNKGWSVEKTLTTPVKEINRWSKSCAEGRKRE